MCRNSRGRSRLPFTAYFYDSEGGDVFESWSDMAWLYGSGSYNRVKSFDRVSAYATEGGYDRAYLYDSSGDDQLEAAGSSATLSRPGVLAFAEAFEWLRAISSQGGSDTKEVGTLDYLLETEGPWVDI